MEKRKSNAVAEWFVVIVGAVITVFLYHCFEDLTGVKYTDGETTAEKLGIIFATGFLGYFFGALPAGYMMAHKMIKGSFFTNALLGVVAMQPVEYSVLGTTYYDYSGSGLGVGFFAASIALPFVLCFLTGMIAYPYYLLRRILGIFLRTDERIDKAMRFIVIAFMILSPILGFILPIKILKGEEGMELAKMVLVACLIVDALILFLFARAKKRMKKQLAEMNS